MELTTFNREQLLALANETLLKSNSAESVDEKKKLDDACDLITGYLNYRMEKDALRDVFYQGLLDAAVSGAEEGVEATRSMKPVFGKAAVHANVADGVADQGAVAGLYLLKGMQSYIKEA